MFMWKKKKVDPCQKYSGRILAILILVSMIVCCSVGIFYFSSYYNTFYQGIDNIKTVVYSKRDTCVSIRTGLAALNKSMLNLTIPTMVATIENGTYTFDSYLSSTQSTQARALEQWGVVVLFAIIMLISVTGLMSVFFRHRFLFILVAIVVGIMFIFLLVAAVTSSVATIVLSDFCVGGVDNLTRLAIDSMINDTCTADNFRYSLFCFWRNTSCDTLDKFASDIELNILNFTELCNLYPNNTLVPKWRAYSKSLRDISYYVNQLASCDSTQTLYLRVTGLFCGNTTPAIVMFTLVIELMVGIIFIFLLVVIRFNPEAGKLKEDDVDMEMDPTKGGKKKGLKPKKEKFQKKPKTRSQTCLQCLGGFVTLFIGWALTIFIMFLIMAIGSNQYPIPRTIQPVIY